MRAGARLRITRRGRVIAEIVPPSVLADAIDPAPERLHGSVLRYDSPLEPAIAAQEWEMLR